MIFLYDCDLFLLIVGIIRAPSLIYLQVIFSRYHCKNIYYDQSMFITRVPICFFFNTLPFNKQSRYNTTIFRFPFEFITTNFDDILLICRLQFREHLNTHIAFFFAFCDINAVAFQLILRLQTS